MHSTITEHFEQKQQKKNDLIFFATLSQFPNIDVL